MVVYGLPSGHNAQEEFLLGRIGASSFLRDRIRTRLTQAFGRCTRGPTDYAAIILIGSPLVDFCIQKEVRSNMHPELQAELDYGLNMSGDANPDDWKEFIKEIRYAQPDEFFFFDHDFETGLSDAITLEVAEGLKEGDEVLEKPVKKIE